MTKEASHFCSPDSIASYTDQASGETYIAIADQCNYRLMVYRWSDIAKAIGTEVAPAGATLATNLTRPEDKTAPVPVIKGEGTTSPRTAASRSKASVPGGSKITNSGKGVVKSTTDKVTGRSKEKVKSGNDVTARGKKAKKEKKVKY